MESIPKKLAIFLIFIVAAIALAFRPCNKRFYVLFFLSALTPVALFNDGILPSSSVVLTTAFIICCKTAFGFI